MWKYVPVDIGSRGCFMSEMPGFDGKVHCGNSNSNEFPNQPVIKPSLRSQKETNFITNIRSKLVQPLDLIYY